MWVQTFVNWGLMLCALEPWIDANLAVFIPEPRNFLPDLPPFEAIAETELQRHRPDFQNEAMEDMLEAAAFTARDEHQLAQILALTLSELTDDDRAAVLQRLNAYRAANPVRYAPSEPEYGSLITGGSGQNVFEAAWIADAVGGYLVPRGAVHGKLFRSFSRGDANKDKLDALASAFAAAKLPMLNNVSLAVALELRKTNRLASFRRYLYDVWAATAEASIDPKSPDRERELADRLIVEHRAAVAEWSAMYKDLGVKAATSLFAAPLAQVFQAGVVPAAAGGLWWAYHSWSSNTRAHRRDPAALLVELENESSPNPLRRIAARIERRA
jgi:hypothetical protein